MLTYESVTQILDMVGRVHERLFSKVEGLSDNQLNYRSQDGTWTIAEIMEHLANVHEGMGKVTSKLVKEAETSGASARSDGTIGSVSMEFLRDLADHKFHAPENVRPAGGVRIEDSIERLKGNYERLLSMKPRIESVDLSGPTFPHAAFGPLNGYQWLALIGLHESKHLEQIKAIQASPGYPSEA